MTSIQSGTRFLNRFWASIPTGSLFPDDLTASITNGSRFLNATRAPFQMEVPARSLSRLSRHLTDPLCMKPRRPRLRRRDRKAPVRSPTIAQPAHQAARLDPQLGRLPQDSLHPIPHIGAMTVRRNSPLPPSSCHRFCRPRCIRTSTGCRNRSSAARTTTRLSCRLAWICCCAA